MRYAFYSDTGDRNINEDAYLVETKDYSAVFAVADGLGGIEAGELAAQTAIKELHSRYEKQSFDVKSAVCSANNRVLNLQKMTHQKMKTTIAVVYVTEDTVVCSNVGDSRIYLFNQGRISYQSVDHTASQMAVYLGEITQEQIRHHADRNLLTRALGVDENFLVDEKRFSLKEVDAFLICSDGFWEYVSEDEMLSILKDSKSPNEWLTRMRRLLDEFSDEKKDNNTAVACMLR